MNEIPTPRTDAEWNNLDGQWHERAVKLCHFTQELERELTTARKQLLESESARNRNFQSASEAMETVAKLSAKLETCTLQMEQYSRIMLKNLAELTNKTANLAHADTKIGELQDFIKTQSAELAKVKEEYDGLVDLANKQAFAEGIRLGDALRECDMLRAENAAKDERIAALDLALRMAEPFTQVGVSRGPASEAWIKQQATMTSAFSTTPPTYVPVEVVAKLVEALEAMHRGSLQNGNTRESSDIIWAGHKASKEARALAAPFLTKGESKV